MFLFKARHLGPELMDNPLVNPNDLKLNLEELENINTLLGGYNTTFRGLKKLMTDHDRTYHILDIGCGGGDTIAATHAWATKNNYKVKFTGLDLSVTAIEKSQKRCAHIEATDFLNCSFQELRAVETSYDIIMCSLFTHHFYGADLLTLLKIMNEKSSLGFVINDLERNKIAWGSISILTQLLSKSHLVKHDAPLSVKRGFTKAEWHTILQEAGVNNYTIDWCWAFRHCITSSHA